MEFIDTHTHISDEAFQGGQEEVISRAVEAGVTQMLLPDIDSSERGAMLQTALAHPGVLHHMIGLYPGSVDENWRDEFDELLKYRDSGAVAIGEIGLDYHYGRDTAALQKEAFRAQLELAAQWNLPVNIHLREASDDFFEILGECSHLGLRGNLHAFSGSYETFCRLQRYGDWMVGIGGVATFRNSSIGRDLERIPLDRIVLETDAPYLAPVPHRGSRNESSLIPVIAAFVASRKGVGIGEVAAATTRNARQLFNI